MSTQRYQHVRFHALRVGENFHHGKFLYSKTSYFLGRAHLDGNAVVVMPWTKVRSTRPYGPLVNKIVGHIAKVLAVNAPYLDVVNATRPPVPVTPGGDRRSETIGGSELTPSA